MDVVQVVIIVGVEDVVVITIGVDFVSGHEVRALLQRFQVVAVLGWCEALRHEDLPVVALEQRVLKARNRVRLVLRLVVLSVAAVVDASVQSGVARRSGVRVVVFVRSSTSRVVVTHFCLLITHLAMFAVQFMTLVVLCCCVPMELRAVLDELLAHTRNRVLVDLAVVGGEFFVLPPRVVVVIGQIFAAMVEHRLVVDARVGGQPHVLFLQQNLARVDNLRGGFERHLHLRLLSVEVGAEFVFVVIHQAARPEIAFALHDEDPRAVVARADLQLHRRTLHQVKSPIFEGVIGQQQRFLQPDVFPTRREVRRVVQLKCIEAGVHLQNVLLAEDRGDAIANLQNVRLGD